ncbi:probable histone H2B 3 [Struthio camelus]|uniref:probable histone H2B 3 n=1 Tax=Struthio camelus TaxID=8801 RepID=UPI00051E5005|nr:PREDICTED: histone H2B.5-like [Struthio camelus australis]
MAAGGKRPEKSPRRKKPKAQRAKPPAKPRKSPAGRCKPALKRLSCEVKKRSCSRYISRLMNRLRPGHVHMSAKAKRLMNSSMCILCKGVVTEADRRRRQRRGSFIGTSEVQAALDKVMKGKAGVYVASTIPSRSS